MTGSKNAQQTQTIITNIETAEAVQGTPGAWAISPSVTIHAFLGAKIAAVGSAPAVTVSAGETMLAQAAVAKSNAAAALTPSAASGSPTTATTTIGVITTVAQGLSNLPNIPADIQQLEAGTVATLHWWGWEAKLNEDATQALLRLLGTDVAALVSIATALAVVSAPLAAVAGIIGAVSTGFDAWVVKEDASKKGVIIDGYLWVGIWVKGQ